MSGRRCVLRPGHPIYGEVVRSLTPAVRVAAMARTLAEVVEGCGARRREDALRVGVWRLDGGGGRHDTMLAAADAARWRYDFALAERLARAAMSARESFEAAFRAAECCALKGDPLQAERELRAMTALAGDDAQRARLALGHMDVLWRSLGRSDEALRRAEEAEQAITDPNLREEVAGRRPGLLLITDGPARAAAVVDSLIERASARSLAWIGLTGAFAYARVGRIADALDAAQRAYAAGLSLSTPYGRYPWFALYARCEALAQSGRYDEAWTLAQEQYDLGLQAHSVEARAFFLSHMARSVHDRGDAIVASRRAQESLALFRQLGRVLQRDVLGAVRVLALALAGQPEEARQAVAVLDVLDIVPEWYRCDELIARAWVDVAEGALERARAKLLEAADRGESNGDLLPAATALHDVARLGRPREVVSRLARLAECCEGSLVEARALHARALADGDAQLLAALAERFAAMGAHLLAAETAVDVVRHLAAAGTARQEAAARQRAAVLRERCGVAVTPGLQAVDTRSLLTPAEYETALLAAAGRSNQAIAAELHLSVRTVGNRLQRVYEKLGISRRTDLGRLLH
jgi:DNA-binding CsgD family transcriptional regulator